MRMQSLLKLEDLALFGLSVYLFAGLDYAWWWFPLLLLTPDLGAIGYLVSPRLGAATYNFTHHRATAAVAYIAGGVLAIPVLQLAGVIVLAHGALDRVLGYGLKYPDSFQHTHLGTIGRGRMEGGP